MTSIDKMAIAWSLGIVAIFVALAASGDSLQGIADVKAPEPIVRPGTLEEPSYEETKPKTDPFADLAAEVRGQTEESSNQDKEQKQMKEQEQKQMKEQEQKGPKTVNVSIPSGTSVPGCEVTNECYLPYSVTISKGDTVSWSNDDTAAHTVTSGSPSEGPDGNFDSSLVMSGAVYEFTFEQTGSYDYFCMVHPWMTGIVQVN
ncbi:MAG: plastocyanin/azurin family copper-binding protein [Candidatus Nitrosopumilus sp. bin_68KS]